MFENPAYQLKGVVKTVVSIQMVVSVLSGLMIFLLAKSFDDEFAIGGFIVGCAVAISGCVGWWLIGLWLLTFAEMGDDIDDIKLSIVPNKLVDTRNVEVISQEKNKGMEVEKKITKKPIEVELEGPAAYGMRCTKREGVDISKYPHNKKTQWICSSCMKVNELGKMNCTNCGCSVALK